MGHISNGVQLPVGLKLCNRLEASRIFPSLCKLCFDNCLPLNVSRCICFERWGVMNSVSSVAQSCPTLWNPMDCGTPSLPVHHQLPSLLKLMSVKSVMPSNHLILCHPPLLPSILPSIRVFSSKSVLHIRWPKYWSFSFNISPSMNIQDWSPLGWTGLIALQSKGLRSLLQHHSSKASVLRCSAFLMVCLSHPYWKIHSFG